MIHLLPSRLLDAAALGELLSIKRGTIYAWVAEGAKMTRTVKEIKDFPYLRAWIQLEDNGRYTIYYQRWAKNDDGSPGFTPVVLWKTGFRSLERAEKVLRKRLAEITRGKV